MTATACKKGNLPTNEMSPAEDIVSSQAVWQSILTNVAKIEDSTDFFKSGAASMDVVR